MIPFTGKLVEYDEPNTLMKREGSLFRQLVQEYWSHFHSSESHWCYCYVLEKSKRSFLWRCKV